MNGDRGFLARWYAEIVGTGRSFQHRVLLPLFFGTLNTLLRMRASAARAFGRVPFLNGGLFARTPLERRLRELPGFGAMKTASLVAVLGKRFGIQPPGWEDAVRLLARRQVQSLRH